MAGQVHWLHAFCFVFLCVLTSMLGIFVVYLPALPLLAVSNKLFDNWNEMMMGTWFHMVAGYLELVYRMKVVVTGDRIPWNEGCVIVMNHRTQMDWVLLWNLLARFGDIRCCKIILKNSLKQIPGAGWAMQQAMFLFLSRKWESDSRHFNSVLNYFIETDKPVQILLFPEGTDFCEETKVSSDKFAKQRDLPTYHYVLHPRTRGFFELVKTLRYGNIKSVVDLTVGYPVNIPSGFRSFVIGNFPEQAHFNIKRYLIEDFPKDDESLQEWCRQRWSEKEDILRVFYDRGQFDQPQVKFVRSETQMLRKMLFCLILWVAIVVGSLFLLYVSSWWRWVCILGSAIYVGFTVFGGVEKTIIDAHNRRHSSSA